MTLLYILLSTVLLGSIAAVGICFLSVRSDVKKTAFYFLSLASGTMLGTTFFHLIPESMEQNPHGALQWVCVGVFVFFILEKFLIWRHCHLHQHTEDIGRRTSASMVIAGDAVHNLIDGIIVASSYIAGTEIGVSVTVAILLHEIPQELGDFGVLIHGGYSVKRALAVNLLTATTAILGALIAYFSVENIPVLQTLLLPVAAGGFLYIALADLIPQLHLHVTGKQTLAQIVLLAAGFGFMMLFRH